jgi:hypothetical protein
MNTLQKAEQSKSTTLSPIQNFELQLKRAEILSRSTIIPKEFQSKPGDCFIVMEIADRLGLPAFTMFQNVDVIYGRVGVRGSFARALCQSRTENFVSDGFETQGSLPASFASFNPGNSDYAVRYFIEKTSKVTGETKKHFGPWIGLALAKSMGWWDKKGSFWSQNSSMCERMCKFRAVSWYVKDEDPNLLVGLPFAEELRDYDPIDITPAKATSAQRAFAKTPEESPIPDPVIEDTNESKEETDSISLDAAKALKEYSQNQGYKIGEILPAVLGRDVVKITDISHSELRDVEMWLKQNPR